jgi:hypothetical protein
MKAADIIACINARLPHVESFEPLTLGPQCLGVWSIRQHGLSCRLEIAADDRWQMYPARLLVPLSGGPGVERVLLQVQSALRGHTFGIDQRTDGEVPQIQVRFQLAQDFYVDGLPWIVKAIVATVARAAGYAARPRPTGEPVRQEAVC